MNEVSMYHMLLRISAMVIAVVLVFDSGFLFPITKQLSLNTQEYLANTVGATASVKPNELNVVTAQLTQRQRELDDREAALNEREISVGLNTDSNDSSETSVSTYVLSVLLFIILVLIVLNYVLDFARARRLSFVEKYEQNA